MCRRFGTPCSIFIDGISRENNQNEIDGYLYGKGLAQKFIQENVWLKNLCRKRFGSQIYAGKSMTQKFIHEKGLAQKFIQEKVWLKNLYRKRVGSKIYTGKSLTQKFIQEKVWLKNLYRKSLAQKFIQEKLWLKNLYRKRFGSKICTGKDLAQKCLLAVELSTSHSDTPHSVGRLWTSDRPVAEAST